MLLKNQNNLKLNMTTSSSFAQGELASFRKAVTSNNKQSIEKHLSNMKNISESELNQALFTCIENFRIDEQTDECLFLLLRYKVNPNCEINGQTPLIAACKTAQITLVKNLIENGAKPDHCNTQGKHPLQFILNARKQNYDVAQYLISVMSSVNIEVDKSTPLTMTVQKEFHRIFKMLVDKGANLVLNNQETILHVIMRKKFKDIMKKKKFLKELANRWQLSQHKDKFGKLPLQYEQDNDIKVYYQEIFKPKIKSLPQKQKDHHSKLKQKELSIRKESSREKQHRKKPKQEDVPAAAEEQGVEEQENDDQAFSAHIANDQDKQKIVQVVQQQQEEKKIEEEKEKVKKGMKILTPNSLVNSKKNVKAVISKVQKIIITEKPVLLQKSSVMQKDKGRKLLTDKKKMQVQTTKKKNKSFTTVNKRLDVEQQKKQQQVRKKGVARSGTKQQQLKKISRKSSELKLQKCQVKFEEQQKAEQTIIIREQSYELKTSEKHLSNEDQQQIKKLMNSMTAFASQILSKVEQFQKKMQQRVQKGDESEQEQVKPNKTYNIQQELTCEIIHILDTQQQQYQKSQTSINSIITYLENKMKLCLQSHLQHAFSLKIAVYGSQATALSVNHSDIDLLVITTQSPIDLINMFEAYEIFREEEISEVKFIKGATMPVIKLTMGELFANFKVDITFQLRGHTGIRCSQLIQEFKTAQPLLKPLVIVLKRIIYAYSLADPYTGGLSSYSLTLMVIALLQLTQIQKIRENIGKLFLQFLLFYGYQIDYVCQAIIIHPPVPGDYKPYYSIYQLPNTMDLTPKLVIYDPLNPVNNVGRTTYRIQCLKTLFRVIYIRLKSESLKIRDILSPEFIEVIQDIY